MSWPGCPLSFCAGNRPSLWERMFLYCSNARQNLSFLRDLSVHDIQIIFSWILPSLPLFHHFVDNMVLESYVEVPTVEKTDGTCWI